MVDGKIIRDSAYPITGGENVILCGNVMDHSPCVLLAQYKRGGTVCTRREAGQISVLEDVPEELCRKRVMPIGRLDKDTEGLLLLTDDGALAHRILSEPIAKEYRVTLAREWDHAFDEVIESGITLKDGTVCRPAELMFTEDPSVIVLRIWEGKYHEVKRMMAACGNHVEFLRREAIGGLTLREDLAELKAGETMELTQVLEARIFEQPK